jgi:hypothetical protein
MANTAGLPTYNGYRTRAMTALYPTMGLKVALFLASATITPATTAYSTTGEVTGTGYTAGGITVDSSQAPQISSSTTYWTPAADWDFGTVTLSTAFDCAQVYDTNATNASLGVFTFGSQTVTAANFTVQMPTDNSSTALARWTWA